MDKKTYCKKFMLWTAVVVAVAMLVIGLLFGKVVEESLFAEIAKWVVSTAVIICIFEVFAYILGPLFWHIKYDKNDDVDKISMD